MIDPGHPRLSVVRQCELVSISRSSFYREPTPERRPPVRPDCSGSGPRLPQSTPKSTRRLWGNSWVQPRVRRNRLKGLIGRRKQLPPARAGSWRRHEPMTTPAAPRHMSRRKALWHLDCFSKAIAAAEAERAETANRHDHGNRPCNGQIGPVLLRRQPVWAALGEGGWWGNACGAGHGVTARCYGIVLRGRQVSAPPRSGGLAALLRHVAGDVDAAVDPPCCVVASVAFP
jgi:hypothetical protein